MKNFDKIVKSAEISLLQSQTDLHLTAITLEQTKKEVMKLEGELRLARNKVTWNKNNSAVALHLNEGKCFAEKKVEYALYSSQCENKAKTECLKCGAPVCGTHGKVSTYGNPAHSCNDWKTFANQNSMPTP